MLTFTAPSLLCRDNCSKVFEEEIKVYLCSNCREREWKLRTEGMQIKQIANTEASSTLLSADTIVFSCKKEQGVVDDLNTAYINVLL